MRLSQNYADTQAQVTSMVSYLAAEAGAPSDNATRPGVPAADITLLVSLRTSFAGAEK